MNKSISSSSCSPRNLNLTTSDIINEFSLIDDTQAVVHQDSNASRASNTLQQCDQKSSEALVKRLCAENIRPSDDNNSVFDSAQAEEFDYTIPNTSLNICISFEDFVDQKLHIQNIISSSNENPKITLEIKTDDELDQMNNLLANGQLNKNQALVLDKIKSVIFGGLNNINLLLSIIETRLEMLQVETVHHSFTLPILSKLKMLSLKNVLLCDLTLLSLPELTILELGTMLESTLRLPILPKLTILKFAKHVDRHNIDNINQIFNPKDQSLSFFPQLTTLIFEDIHETPVLSNLPQLITLKFGAIHQPLAVSSFSQLKALQFGDIWNHVTISMLSQLTTLEFGNIWDYVTPLTLQELPNLTTLKFGDVGNVLIIPNLPCLTTLKFGDILLSVSGLSHKKLPFELGFFICNHLELPILEELKILEFGDIKDKITLPSFPKLTTLKFGDLHDTVILSSSQLKTLEFGYIRKGVFLTLPSFCELTMLKFGSIHETLMLPELLELRTLEFGNVNAALTLSNLPKLTTLKFGTISATVTLRNPELLELIDVNQLGRDLIRVDSSCVIS